MEPLGVFGSGYWREWTGQFLKEPEKERKRREGSLRQTVREVHARGGQIGQKNDNQIFLAFINHLL